MQRALLDEVAVRRLRNQRLTGPLLGSAADVVRWLGAVQAQEYPVARWSVGRRARKVREADVDAALADGSLVRTHVLRETWHLVCREDIRWLLEVTAPRVYAGHAARYRQLGLEPDVLAHTDELVREALAARGPLTRKELGGVLGEEGARLAHVLIHAELGGIAASGPRRGKQHTYALLDAPARPHRGLVELVERYFASHGPATAKDFAWWASQTVSATKEALAASGLVREQIDGREYWSAASRVPRRRAAPDAVLLQCYDEYIVGYTESRDVIQQRGVTALVPPRPMTYMHAVVLDGQVVGRWRRTPAGAVELQLSVGLARAGRDAVDRAVADFERFSFPRAGDKPP